MKVYLIHPYHITFLLMSSAYEMEIHVSRKQIGKSKIKTEETIKK